MKEQILLVDDEVHLLESNRALLRKEYDVHTAIGAKEGITALEKHGPFSAIVSDLQMPKMNGIEFLSLCKEKYPSIPRVLLSGNANLEDTVQSVNESNIFRLLIKPCSIDNLKKTLADCVEQTRLLQTRDELRDLRQIQEAMEGVLLGFTNALEARDPYTAGHQRRVAELCTAMATKLGLGKESFNSLRMAALVHDIGKIYVPADFLNRPGKLSEIEFEVVKTHVQKGYDILAPINFTMPICEVVLQHHEKLDGSGYPNGLMEAEIMEEARILAVADVVEAISAHRPYRPSLGIEFALEEVTKLKGIYYCPNAVDAVVALFKEDDFQFSV